MTCFCVKMTAECQTERGDEFLTRPQCVIKGVGFRRMARADELMRINESVQLRPLLLRSIWTYDPSVGKQFGFGQFPAPYLRWES